MDRSRLLARAQGRGVNPVIYWLARAVLQPFFLVYFRMKRIGMEHIPADGPLIIASNHRSFMDPWVIGMMLRRPVYYVAKTELFHHRFTAWILSSLGAFPVDRGGGDRDAMDAARRILERGDVVVIFPEGTRTRPGALGAPKRGVGRLALETGAPVVPVALIGTEAVRRGWRIRPHKVRIRAGRPLRFPKVDNPSPALARAVTERIWPCVELQWEWLGGTPALRRAAIVGAGSWGTGLAVAFARAGLEVELGCRTEKQAVALGARARQPPLPAERPAARVRARHEGQPPRARPRRHRLLRRPGGRAAGRRRRTRQRDPRGHGRPRALQGPRRAQRHAAQRLRRRARQRPRRRLRRRARPRRRRAALRRLARHRLHRTRCSPRRSRASSRTPASAPTRRPTSPASSSRARRRTPPRWRPRSPGVSGPNAAGAAAGKVFAEVDAFSRSRGGHEETFAGLAGAGDLVATVVAEGSRNRRAGELLGQGVSAASIGDELGQSSEALDGVGLLAETMRREGVPSPTLDHLAALVDGRIDADEFTAAVTAPGGRFRRAGTTAAPLATAASGATERGAGPG